MEFFIDKQFKIQCQECGHRKVCLSTALEDPTRVEDTEKPEFDLCKECAFTLAYKLMSKASEM